MTSDSPRIWKIDSRYGKATDIYEFTDDEEEALSEYLLIPGARVAFEQFAVEPVGLDERRINTPRYVAFPRPPGDLWLRLPPVVRYPVSWGVMATGLPIFALDPDEVWLAARSADVAHITRPDLPQLPFPAIMVETYVERTWTFTLSQENSRESDGDHSVIGIIVNETIPGIEWVAMVYMVQIGTEHLADPNHKLLTAIITPSSVSTVTSGYRIGSSLTDRSDWTIRELDETWAPMRSTIVEAVYLIDAAPPEAIHGVPRQERRRYQRVIGKPHPQATIITIGGTTSEPSGHHEGRVYSCRWIVRGHYRRLPSGKRTWVRSHIKGPAGAPWRDPFQPVRVHEASRDT